MRSNIMKLIESGISPLQVSKSTGIPQNTVYRIFKGEATLDNITLKNAELLSAYLEDIIMQNKNPRDLIAAKKDEELRQAAIELNQWLQTDTLPPGIVQHILEELGNEYELRILETLILREIANRFCESK